MSGLREQWASGGTTLGAWLALPGPVGAEAAARAGFDYVCADLQHGSIGEEGVVPVLQAVALGGSSPVVRVRWNEPGAIGRALDAGAEGIVVPMVNSPEEAEGVVRAMRYSPVGARSFGPYAAAMRWDDYSRAADGLVAVIPMIETTQALARLDDILSVEGIDAVYVGPADLSLTLGLPPGNNDGQPAFDDALAQIVAACRNHGVVPGMHASGALAGRRLEQGFRMLTVASDLVSMRAHMADELATARSGAQSGDGGAIY